MIALQTQWMQPVSHCIIVQPLGIIYHRRTVPWFHSHSHFISGGPKDTHERQMERQHTGDHPSVNNLMTPQSV